MFENPIAHPQQENLYATFFNQPVRQGYLSEQEGRDIYKDEVHIRIKSPGDNLTEIVRKATENDKRRFPQQWMYFQQANDSSECVTGTPVGEWSACTRSMAEEFRASGFKTVESIANASDGQLQRIMGGLGWRIKAQAFLKQAQDSAFAQHQATENEHLKQMIADLQAQITELGKPKRGRPRNAGEEEKDD